MRTVFLFLFLSLLFSCTESIRTSPPSSPPVTSVNDELVSLNRIISNGVLPDLSQENDNLVKDTLARLGGSIGVEVSTIYVSEKGLGNHSGKSWLNSVAGINLKKTIDDISDASSSKVYLILIEEGVYYVSNATMKNHTAIIGGFKVDINELSISLNRDGVTALDGANINRVFLNGNNINRTAVLYGVTIQNGNPIDDHIKTGGGMKNTGASPSIIKTRFISNYASGGFGYEGGGAMVNNNSTAYLKQVDFLYNSTFNGGGALFNQLSAVVVEDGFFAFNSSRDHGHAIADRLSSSLYINVVVFSNFSSQQSSSGTSTWFMDHTSLVLINSDVLNNEGAVYINNGGTATEPYKIILLNSIFWDNGINNYRPTQLLLSDPSLTTYSIAGSVLKGGTNEINHYGYNLVISNYNVISNNPNYTLNYSSIDYSKPPTISSSSFAKDIGLHIKMEGEFQKHNRLTGAELFFSIDNQNWYKGFTSSQLVNPVNPPSTAKLLTEYDVLGKRRVNRPDAGVFEVIP